MDRSLSNFSACLESYPTRLWDALQRLVENYDYSFYLTGGSIRDYLLAKEFADIDLTIKEGAIECCYRLIDELGSGTFVPLDKRREDSGRVVWQGNSIDFSSFRADAQTIEEDLHLRDFTVNSMAVDLTPYLLGTEENMELIDPLSGVEDLNKNVLRSLPGAFKDDPLRLLRGFRFQATSGLRLEEETRKRIVSRATDINTVSAERILYELDCIISAETSYSTLYEMAQSSLLFHILPELRQGVGVEQPGFHHLDVFRHNLETLKQIEKVMREPERFYPEQNEIIRSYIALSGKKNELKWAALFHDLGKPATMAISKKDDGRVTFYGHDHEGGHLFEQISGRLKWSNRKSAVVAGLITSHMHPFHLCTILRNGKLSKRSCLRLYKRAEENLTGLFILSMADSLAGQGELKPAGMEEDLAHLFTAVLKVYNDNIQPALAGPKLISGYDLIQLFKLTPGPLFSTILDELEVARVEGAVNSRDEALEWVRGFLQKNQ